MFGAVYGLWISKLRVQNQTISKNEEGDQRGKSGFIDMNATLLIWAMSGEK